MYGSKAVVPANGPCFLKSRIKLSFLNLMLCALATLSSDALRLDGQWRDPLYYWWFYSHADRIRYAWGKPRISSGQGRCDKIIELY